MGGSDVCATNLHSHEARPRSHHDSRVRSTELFRRHGKCVSQTWVTISYQKVQKVGGWWMLDPDQRDLVQLGTSTLAFTTVLVLSSDRVPTVKGERANLTRT